jgi:hypothetical protein
MWSSDGKRLFYVRESGRNTTGQKVTFYSVEVVRTSVSFETGKPNALFSVDGLFSAAAGRAIWLTSHQMGNSS